MSLKKPNQQQQTQTNEQCLKKFFKEIGTGAYILLFLTTLILLTKNQPNLILTPSITKNFKLWTLFTFPFSPLGLLNTLFHVFFIVSWSFLGEKNEGTAYFLYWIVFYAFLQGLIHFFLILLNLNFWDLRLISIWPVYFLDISRRCFENPKKISAILFVPIDIKNLFFPFVIFFISFVLNKFVFVWSDITSIFLGFLIMKFEKKFKRIIISNKNIKKIDFLLSFFGFLGTFYNLENRENVNNSYFQKKIVKFFDYNRKMVLKFIKKKYKKKKNISIENDIENTGFSKKGTDFLETVKEVEEENYEEFEKEEIKFRMDEDIMNKSQLSLDNAKIARNGKKDVKEEDMFSI